jgi:predicted MFS family arabinose efflux permease
MTRSRPTPWGRLVVVAGGRDRLRVVVLLASALALAAGTQTIVGAVAPDLKVALGIDNTAVGLLITAASLVGAVTTLPFGILADRTHRVRLLAWCVLSWSVAVTVAGFSDSYQTILAAQIALGAGIGAATPIVASLTGDLFPSSDRGRVYALILAGEFTGAAAALLLAGEMAAWWSWRGSFWVLALPGPILAFTLLRTLPEPIRGGQQELATDDPTEERSSSLTSLVRSRGIEPDRRTVLTADPTNRSMWWAVKYVLTIRSNVYIILASALVYFYVAGLQAFIVIFLRGRYDFDQNTATLLLLTVGIATVTGTLLAGPLSDRWIGRGRISARPMLAGIACLAAFALAVPGVVIPTFLIGWPLLLVASALIGAANPPLDAARLDVVHSRLWGRAESVRNFVQTLLKSSAPLLFGWLSTVFTPAGMGVDEVQGDGAVGLTRAFLVLLVVLVVAGALLLVAARRSYPRDVATAIASEDATQRA